MLDLLNDTGIGGDQAPGLQKAHLEAQAAKLLPFQRTPDSFEWIIQDLTLQNKESRVLGLKRQVDTLWTLLPWDGLHQRCTLPETEKTHATKTLGLEQRDRKPNCSRPEQTQGW